MRKPKSTAFMSIDCISKWGEVWKGEATINNLQFGVSRFLRQSNVVIFVV